MKLEEFCSRFHTFLEQKPETPQIFKTGQQLVGELLRDAQWFGEILHKLISDSAFSERQTPSVFANEVTLYRSPDRLFSVLAYIWEPHALCEIHDHSSWGIIGSLFHPIREVRYRRLDDGRLEGYAELEEISSRVIEPGEMARVLPLDKGIHQTGSATDQFSISLGIYGQSIRKGYFQLFNPSEKKVVRAYPPKLFKQILAIRALKSAPDLWAKEISATSSLPLPEYLAKEF
jgi:predicted metal-dependent enzyme (double-stranded beta helix superfamily)